MIGHQTQDAELAAEFVELAELLLLSQREAGARINRTATTINRWRQGVVPEMTNTTRRAVLEFIAEVAELDPRLPGERKAQLRAQHFLARHTAS